MMMKPVLFQSCGSLSVTQTKYTVSQHVYCSTRRRNTLCHFCVASRKPDIHVPYLYVDMGAAVLCASFMSFGVKRRWFAMAAAVQLALSTYASYIGEQVFYGDWLKVSLLLWFSCVRAAVQYHSSPPHCLLRPLNTVTFS